MTPEQKTLVQQSWKQVEPIADTAADLFYNRLFELDPEVRSLFSNSDMHAQGVRLMSMIGQAVGMLDRLDTLVPVVQRLGARHSGYGVVDRHYVTVGKALLDTLEKGLGDAFTADVRAAWVDVYKVLADTMRHAAREAA